MEETTWIAPYIKQYRRFFVLTVFLGLLAILFSGALMFTSGYLISTAAARPETILLVYVPIVGVRAFGIGRAVLSYLERLAGHSFVLKILSSMRVRLYSRLEPQAHQLKSRYATGDVLGMLADDIEHLQNLYLKTIFPTVISLVVYASVIAFAGAFSLPFALVLLMLMGLLLTAGPIYSYIYMKNKQKQLKQGKHILYQKLADAVFGISDWLFSGRSFDFIGEYESAQLSLQKIEDKKRRFVHLRDIGNQLILGMVVLSAIYFTSGMAESGEFSPVFIAAFVLMLLSITEAFFPVSETVSDISAYQDSIRRLEHMEDNQASEWPKTKIDGLKAPSDILIEFRNVSFHYSEETPLLDHFDLTIQPGEKIAILGPSGAGKSTLLKLLQGALVPAGGEVLIAGKQAGDYGETISDLISVLNQKPYLFHTSVRNNLALGNPGSTDETIWAAAKKVQLHDKILKLPHSYETNMHESGQRFSGGERQRIALARILLKNTPVILMDEPTIGLDPATENQLLDTIFDNLQDQTMIWVTHHLAGMEKMDRILFIDKGRITMAGSHRELLQKQERYRRLFELDCPFVKP